MKNKILSLSLLFLFSVVIASCTISKKETGVLEGKVSIGPLVPVVQEGVSEPTPAPEVYAARQIVIYSKNGKKEITKVPINTDGTYRIELATGEYMVDINRIGIDFSKDLPVIVEIVANQTYRLDIDIDTGIR